MSDPGDRIIIIRRHHRRTDDRKGYRRLIAGRRFRLPAGLDAREAEHRCLLIEALWRDNENFCRQSDCELDRVEIALWAADHIRRGQLRVPLPPFDYIASSIAFGD